MIKPGDKNNLSHYILEVRPSETARDLAEQQGYEVSYDGVGLFFCPAAGAEGLFAVGRINLSHGGANILSYNYFDTLGEAEYTYRHRIF